MDSARERPRREERGTTGVAAHLRVGACGEDLAVAHLRRDGMRVLERNWRCGSGELDIVASDRGVTVFCEVKTRRSLRFGTPMQSIDDAKAARIRRLATLWQQQRARAPHLSARARARRAWRAEYDIGALRGHRAAGRRPRRAAGDTSRWVDAVAGGTASSGQPTWVEPPTAVGDGSGGVGRTSRRPRRRTTRRDGSRRGVPGRAMTSGGGSRGKSPGLADGADSVLGGSQQVEVESRGPCLAGAGRAQRVQPGKGVAAVGTARTTAAGGCGAKREPTERNTASETTTPRIGNRMALKSRSQAVGRGSAPSSDVRRRMALAGRCGGRGAAGGPSKPSHGRGGGWSRLVDRARTGRGGGVWGRGLTDGLWVVASAVANTLWPGRGGPSERGGRARRFDVVCVVIGGDGTVTIDHRRGVL